MHLPHAQLPRLAMALCLGLSPMFAQQPAHGIQPANLDVHIKPCTDFFHYANGEWIRKNPIPADQPTWGAFNELQETNRKLLKAILEEAAGARAPKGSPLQKAGDFYASGMDEAAIEKAGVAPMQPILKRIDAIRSPKDLAREIAAAQVLGIRTAFRFDVDQDDKNSTRYIAQFSQGGLGLPDRDYYTRTDAKSLEILDKYKAHVTTMFQLLGENEATAKAHAQVVLRLETRLAKASMTRVEQRNPQAIYHKLTPKELKALAPDFPWTAYFEGIGLKGQESILVRQPEFFKEFGRMAKEIPAADWQAYLHWHTVRAYAGALPDRFGQASFEFYSKTLFGAKQRQERWKRVQATSDEVLGELVGQLYVAKAFTPEAKAKMAELVGNLKLALRERIQGLPWMSADTKKQALHKLDAFGLKIGYPDKWRDYSRLEISRNDYFGNLVAGARFEFHRNLAKLGQPIDRTEWGMNPQTVNAYYSPTMNEIVFPAAILQPPFFDPKADDAVNYGAIGMVIGHEMTHGFDDEGCQFDATGNLKNWWTDADKQAYAARTDLVVKQYDAFEALPGLHVNGRLTLGENIADLGGLKLAFEALKKQWAKTGKPAPADGFTPEQRFFLGYAQAWRFHGRDESVRVRVQTDPHSPAQFRVNGPLANLPEFFEAFGCGDGTPMNQPAASRPSIW